MTRHDVKKFQLVKKYPSLSEDLKIGDEVVYNNDKDYFVDSKNRMYPTYEIEKNAEFWKWINFENYEVIELSYGGRLYEKTGEKHTAFPSGDVVNVFRREGESGMITDENLKNPIRKDKKDKWVIRPTKIIRLSDGLIIGVGDYLLDERGKEFRVEEILLVEDFAGGIKLTYKKGKCGISINYIEASDRGYEMSEEGVRIYEGDSYWYVWLREPFEIQETFKPYKVENYVDEPLHQKSKDAKWFVSKKSAKAFIDSQVLFTTEDGEPVYDGDKYLQLEIGIREAIQKTAKEAQDLEALRELGKLTFSSAQAVRNFLSKRKPLFKTQQGTEIFEGDSYWCVNTAPHLWSLFEQTAKQRTQLNKTVVAFDTEDDAKTYISDHKPVYTRTMVENLIRLAMHSKGFTPDYEVREFCKENL